MQWLLIPLVGAGIGWITNLVAIRLIFRPHKPWRLGKLVFQGVIPKRREEIAWSLGQIIARELLTPEDFVRRLQDAKLQEHMLLALGPPLRNYIVAQLPRLMPMAVKNIVGGLVEEGIRRQGPQLLQHMVTEMGQQMASNLPVAKMVEERISGFDTLRLEHLVWSVAVKELRYIEFWGAVIGGVIGLIQVALMRLLMIV